MPLQRSKRRDDAVDKIRTINWFRCIGDHLDIYIPREIQRFLQPGKTGTGVNSIRNNRYLEYSEGKHVPRPDLVEHADRLVDGSSWELNHVLWSVLRCSGPIHGKEHKWIRELSGDIPTIVIEANNVIRLRGDRHYLGSFERRASLDSLTALTILLRMNHERQDFEQVWECAKSIFRVLLMIGNDLNERCIGALMFDLYAERVFCLARYNGNRIYAEKSNYPAMSRVLYELAEHLREKNSHVKDRKSKNHYLIQILSSVQIGEFFQPLIGPDLDIGAPTKAYSEWLSVRNSETAEY